MNKCDNIKLGLFSKEHYTYINQIFGDLTVREIIKETYAPRDWEFVIEDTDETFNNSNHHVLQKTGKNGEIIKWCSVDEGYQNLNINKNDTLCQSYTLLKYLNKPIDTNMKKRQMEMVKMYRNILKQEHFKKEFKNVIDIMRNTIKKNKNLNKAVLWKDFTYDEPEPYLIKDVDTMYAEIHNVLDKWENYGYMYFIKEGKCK